MSERQSVNSYANKFKQNIKVAGGNISKLAEIDRITAPEVSNLKQNNIDILNFDQRSTDRDSAQIEPELQYAQDSFNYIYISLRLAMGFNDV